MMERLDTALVCHGNGSAVRDRRDPAIFWFCEKRRLQFSGFANILIVYSLRSCVLELPDVHIISHKALIEFWANHLAAESPLQHWYKAVKKTTWSSFGEVRAMFASADQVGNCVVFNVGGNKYRLITAIHYPRETPQGRMTEGRVYVLRVLTHKEYDRGAWKEDCGCED
jgi:mRNA interferase HigB